MDEPISRGIAMPSAALPIGGNVTESSLSSETPASLGSILIIDDESLVLKFQITAQLAGQLLLMAEEPDGAFQAATSDRAAATSDRL